MILAEDHPKITAVFPHASTLQAVTRVGRGFSGLMISNRAERFLKKHKEYSLDGIPFEISSEQPKGRKYYRSRE
jgi:hypothetical protein